jgi:ElaB/YqjD/DUF883 family membrane-anchored ribosome-binding protein
MPGETRHEPTACRGGRRAAAHSPDRTWYQETATVNEHTRDRETIAEPRAGQLSELALRCAATARERVAGASEQVKAYVGREPLRALGIALGVGVLIGWIIKRR